MFNLKVISFESHFSRIRSCTLKKKEEEFLTVRKGNFVNFKINFLKHFFLNFVLGHFGQNVFVFGRFFAVSNNLIHGNPSMRLLDVLAVSKVLVAPTF